MVFQLSGGFAAHAIRCAAGKRNRLALSLAETINPTRVKRRSNSSGDGNICEPANRNDSADWWDRWLSRGNRHRSWWCLFRGAGALPGHRWAQADCSARAVGAGHDRSHGVDAERSRSASAGTVVALQSPGKCTGTRLVVGGDGKKFWLFAGRVGAALGPQRELCVTPLKQKANTIERNRPRVVHRENEIAIAKTRMV